MILGGTGIVIAAWNVGKYLSETLASILRQTVPFPMWRVVVVNDGSTDDTAGVVEQAVSSWKWPTGSVALLNRPHRGLPTTVNDGMTYLAGLGDGRPEFVACVAGDDMISSNYIETLAGMLRAGINAPCAYGLVTNFGTHGQTGFWHPGIWCPGILRDRNIIPGCAVWRRDVWDKVGGFDPFFDAGCEDWAFAAKAEAMGLISYVRRPIAAGQAIYYHRTRAGSLTGEMTKEYFDAAREMVGKTMDAFGAKKAKAAISDPAKAAVVAPRDAIGLVKKIGRAASGQER